MTRFSLIKENTMKNLLLLLASVLFFTSTIYAQIAFPQDTIARNDRFNNRMFAAYNSEGLIRLTYTSGLGTVSANNEIHYVEEDAMGNFSTVNLTNNAVDDNYATLSIDQNDNVHISYEARDPSIFQIRYMHNVSGSFSAPIEITQGGLNKATPFGKIGADSVMHFVYFTYTEGADNIYYRNYDLRTSTLGPEVLLSNGEAGGDFEATLDIDSDGFIHIAGRSGTTLFSGPLKYFNNTSGSFQEVPTGVAASVNYPRIRVDSDDNVHIVYRTNSRLNYINNVSGSFSSPVQISPLNQLPAGIQSMEIDNQDRLYITYQSSQSASGRGFYLLYSENGVFSDTIKIADITSEYVTRNSSQVITNGQEIAMFYAPGGVRNSVVICDIFMKRGDLFQIIPVELASFTASVNGNDVLLNWSTASEINNSGFEVERQVFSTQSSVNNSEYEVVGILEGNGTTTEVNHYSFTDKGLTPGSYQYRIKQIDFDGSYKYYNLTETIEIGLPTEFVLEQNYPNPFNPTTTISWQSPISGWQTVRVYDILGNVISTLVDEYKTAERYEVIFDASNLPSGTYFYRLQAGETTETKKLILIK
jgi:hypothetical protein